MVTKTADFKRYMKHAELARYMGVSSQYTTKLRNQGRLHRDEATGTYDLQHPTNRATVEMVRSTKVPETSAEAPADETIQELQREKLQYERDRTREQAVKYRLQNGKLKGLLIEVDALRHGWGAWGSAVRDNILTLPDRIARGDTKLRDQIARETTRALQAAKDRAEREIMVHGGVPDDRIAEFFAEEGNEDE